MFDHDYFVLRLFRLKSSEEWSSPTEGLCFLFPKEGVGQYINGLADQRLVPGDILVWGVSPGVKLCVPNGAEMVFWSFCLRVEHLLPLFADNEISLLQAVAAKFKGPKHFPAATAMAVKCSRLIEEIPTHPDLEHRSHLLRVAAAILNEEFKTAHRQRIGLGQVEERITRVFEQLSVNELLALPVEELAAKFGCGRRHLNRLFHQYFGFSVGALRMEMRLLKAVSLLRDVNAKVITVAAQCGFYHLGLFNTCFKKRFGATPGRWRKQTAHGKVQPASVPVDGPTCLLKIKGLCPVVGANEDNTPPEVKISPSGESPRTIIPPGMHAAAQVIKPHAMLTYPKAGRSTYLTA
jgi:AraC-like DNA-binding protein